VHFNPFYDSEIFDDLVDTSEDGWEEIFEGSTVTAPQTWGEESYYPLLIRTLDQVCEKATGTSFVVYTGDILTHGFSSKFYALYGSEDEAAMKAFTYKTVAFFASELRDRCGDLPVVFTLGNNDSYEGDYLIEPGGEFLSDTSELFFSTMLYEKADEDEFTVSWNAGGYYSTSDISSDLTVINLNTILFSPEAVSGSEMAAETQLSWFDTELANASAAGKRVWILLHIPPGADIFSSVSSYMDDSGLLSDAAMMWQEAYQQSFLTTLNTYRDSVDAIFSGHTHMDEYRLALEDGNSWKLEIITTPAISPLFGNNPAFKVLTVGGGGWKPQDYEAFNISLDSDDQVFASYYTFSDAYELDGVLESSFATLYSELGSDDSKKATYIDHYYSGNNSSNPIDNTNWPAYRCAIGEMDKSAYIECVNNGS
ncbi:MAG: hypothetical protein HN337_00780, partial [Deltaproteobacteria bacterium]|nr:hypothetical protein [Deltaproteobacteria bacterium]